MSVNSNKNRGKKHFNWSILLIVSLSSIVTGIYRDGFAALFPFLQRDFDLTRAQLGLHSTFFFFAIVLLAVFAGRLVDCKGSKWGLGFGVLFMGIFFILHSIVPNFIVLLIVAAFTGLVVSINPPAVAKGIAEWFPQRWRSTAFGIRSTAFPFGGMLGSIFLPYLGDLLSWRKAILLPGILALLCAFFILHFYQNKREEDKLKINNVNPISFWKDLNQLIKNIDLVAISTYGVFLGFISGAIAAHFTLFLYLDCGLTEKIAGLGFAFVQLGSILGRPIWGLICDRLLGADKSKTFLYIGILSASLSLILGLFLKNFNPHVSILFLLAFLTGFSGRGWQGVYPAHIIETVKEEKIGITIGFSSLFRHSGMMLAPPIFGYIADLRGAYDFSWLFLGLMIFLASIAQYIFLHKNTNKRVINLSNRNINLS